MTSIIEEFLKREAKRVALEKEAEDFRKRQTFIYDDVKNTEAEFFEVEILGDVGNLYEARVLVGQEICKKFDDTRLFFKKDHTFFNTMVDLSPYEQGVVKPFSHAMLRFLSTGGTYVCSFTMRNSRYLNTGGKLLSINHIRTQQYKSDVDRSVESPTRWVTLKCRKPVPAKTNKRSYGNGRQG